MADPARPESQPERRLPACPSGTRYLSENKTLAILFLFLTTILDEIVLYNILIHNIS